MRAIINLNTKEVYSSVSECARRLGKKQPNLQKRVDSCKPYCGAFYATYQGARGDEYYDEKLKTAKEMYFEDVAEGFIQAALVNIRETNLYGNYDEKEMVEYVAREMLQRYNRGY